MSMKDPVHPSQAWFNPYGAAAHAKGSQAGEGLKLPMGPEPKNVMETLVMMEVVQQVQKLPSKQQEFVKVAQIKAYALNALPPMYVTSEKGWEKQWRRGQNEMKEVIVTAVRQGIAAVQRDPLREITQLSSESSPLAETALKQIMRLLGRDDLTWYTVVPALKQALGARGNLPHRAQTPTSNASEHLNDHSGGVNWDKNYRL